MIRWGIIGTGGIASTFAADLELTGSGTAVAVGSRREGSADAFGDRFGIPNRHVGYEALVAATGVSCRQQIGHGVGRRAWHPVELVRAAQAA